MKGLSKINQDILCAADELKEYMKHNIGDDFDTRNGYVVANIKTYDWLDLDESLVGFNLTAEEAEQVKEEFDEDRLWNIQSHENEWAVECFKENTNWRSAKENLPYYKGKLLEREKKAKDYWQAVYDLSISSDDIWQFGRSGGWLSFMKDEPIIEYNYDEFTYVADDLADSYDDNNQMNKHIRELWDGDKKTLLRGMNDAIKHCEEVLENVSIIISDIEAEAEDSIEGSKERLNTEIEEFLSEIGWEESYTGLLPDQIAWINNKESHYNGVLTLVRIKDGKFETSKGVKMEEDYVRELFKTVKPLLVGGKVDLKMKAGNYFVEYAKEIKNDYLIKAGCHKMLLSNFELIFK